MWKSLRYNAANTRQARSEKREAIFHRNTCLARYRARDGARWRDFPNFDELQVLSVVNKANLIVMSLSCAQTIFSLLASRSPCVWGFSQVTSMTWACLCRMNHNNVCRCAHVWCIVDPCNVTMTFYEWTLSASAAGKLSSEDSPIYFLLDSLFMRLNPDKCRVAPVVKMREFREPQEASL